MPADHRAITEALPHLTGTALVLTRDPAAAEDLVQDTLVRALEAAAAFRGDSSVLTWMRRIMHHRFVDITRRPVATPVDPDDLTEVDERWRDDAYTVDADAVLARADHADELRDAIVHLPATLRSALVLHDVDGLTATEVSAIHDVSLDAAKKRIARGRAALVSQLAAGAERRAALDGVPLRCWDARAHVSGYLDDDLEPDLRASLEAHLATCPTCPALYTSLVGATASLGRLRDPETVIPPALAERLRLRLDSAG